MRKKTVFRLLCGLGTMLIVIFCFFGVVLNAPLWYCYMDMYNSGTCSNPSKCLLAEEGACFFDKITTKGYNKISCSGNTCTVTNQCKLVDCTGSCKTATLTKGATGCTLTGDMTRIVLSGTKPYSTKAALYNHKFMSKTSEVTKLADYCAKSNYIYSYVTFGDVNKCKYDSSDSAKIMYQKTLCPADAVWTTQEQFAKDDKECTGTKTEVADASKKCAEDGVFSPTTDNKQRRTMEIISCADLAGVTTIPAAEREYPAKLNLAGAGTLQILFSLILMIVFVL